MGKDIKNLLWLKDYKRSNFLVKKIFLDITLCTTNTIVKTCMHIHMQSSSNLLDVDGTEATMKVSKVSDDEDLYLNGSCGLDLRGVRINEIDLPSSLFRRYDDSLIVKKKAFKDIGKSFILETEVSINPSANTSLMGLYFTDNIFCTQCEPEGFRNITYSIDRPDILSLYQVRIAASKQLFPHLLSNGNLITKGDDPSAGEDFHYAVWQDPFPKPSYLFALVAGNFSCLEDQFVTRSGRSISLKIYAKDSSIELFRWAMTCLKRAMKWDEDNFGLEYDLDLFMIVSVASFNAGAMENKGLNIFNDQYILADERTSTDRDYVNIEGVVAHEYFHNYTGNRVTCRDWFQLCLKEGLTVFRDQCFSQDIRHKNVMRIEDVDVLKSIQFTEDQGPLAHSVQPSSYIEIENFYTATVYEKGAELIRMMMCIVGKHRFENAVHYYLQKHDGQAVTVDDFLTAISEETNFPFNGAFKHWYSQKGTPLVTVKTRYDEEHKTFSISCSQSVMMINNKHEELKKLLVIPIIVGLIGKHSHQRLSALPLYNVSGLRAFESDDGVYSYLLLLQERTQTFSFSNVEEEPVVSLLRGFSAPVLLDDNLSINDRILLSLYDVDPFVKYESFQNIVTEVLQNLISADSDNKSEDSIKDIKNIRYIEDIKDIDGVHAFCQITENILSGVLKEGKDEYITDPSYVATFTTLPSDSLLIQKSQAPLMPQRIFYAKQSMRMHLAKMCYEKWRRVYETFDIENEKFHPSCSQIGKRSLRNRALYFLASLDNDIAFHHYKSAKNMTDKMAALNILALDNNPNRNDALAHFYQSFSDDHLVVNKWLRLHALSINREKFFENMHSIIESKKVFTFDNPNRVYALIGGFAFGNFVQFHQLDGQGYLLLEEAIKILNIKNPQVASFLLSAFQNWRKFDESLQIKIKQTLDRISNFKKLSPNIFEKISNLMS